MGARINLKLYLFQEIELSKINNIVNIQNILYIRNSIFVLIKLVGVIKHVLSGKQEYYKRLL